MVVGPGDQDRAEYPDGHPSQVGSDRIVIAVAALAEYAAPPDPAGPGTATTIEVVDRGNDLPGRMHHPRRPGLAGGPDLPHGPAARHPAGQAQAGHREKHRGLHAQRHHVRHRRHAGRDAGPGGGGAGLPTTVVATGGMAQFVVPLCRRKIQVDRDLLLKGLNIIYKKNASEHKHCEKTHTTKTGPGSGPAFLPSPGWQENPRFRPETGAMPLTETGKLDIIPPRQMRRRGEKYPRVSPTESGRMVQGRGEAGRSGPGAVSLKQQ